MKKSWKKRIAALMVLALLLSALAACGTETASAPVSEAPASSVAAEVPEEVASAPAEAAPEASVVEEAPVEEPEESYFPLAETKELSLWTTFPNDMAAYVDSMDEYGFTKYVEEDLNLDLIINTVSDLEIDTLFPLMIAAGDYSDIMMFGNYNSSLETAAEEDIIIDLTEYMDEYAPEYKAIVEADVQNMGNLTADNGHYYSFYGLYEEGAVVDMGMMTRGDWMVEAGIEATPTTIDEYEEFLTALKTAGHSNALWMDSQGSYYYNVISGAFGVSTGWGCNSFVLVDGEVVCSALQPGMKDYLQTMSRWYANDLIDNDFATNISVYMTDMNEILSGKVGVWMDVADRVPAIEMQLDPGDGSLDLQAVPYPATVDGGPNAYVMKRSYNKGVLYSWVVSTACEDVELAVRFLNYGFTEEGKLLSNWGKEGESYYIDEDGKKMFTDEIMEFPLGIGRGLELYATSYLPFTYDYDVNDIRNGSSLEECKVWSESAGIGENILTLNNMTNDENDIVNGTGANDLATYVKESSLKFMTGALNFESDWDAFIENIETTMDVEAICDAYQAAYDRMVEKTQQ